MTRAGNAGEPDPMRFPRHPARHAAALCKRYGHDKQCDCRRNAVFPVMKCGGQIMPDGPAGTKLTNPLPTHRKPGFTHGRLLVVGAGISPDVTALGGRRLAKPGNWEARHGRRWVKGCQDSTAELITECFLGGQSASADKRPGRYQANGRQDKSGPGVPDEVFGPSRCARSRPGARGPARSALRRFLQRVRQPCVIARRLIVRKRDRPLITVGPWV